MSPADYIKQRQILWALRHGVHLGSQFRHDPDLAKVARGEKSFVFDLRDNLFEPLIPEARQEFERGDGKELRQKMCAVNSSSALSVNLFHYWRRISQIESIARACQVPSRNISGVRFEAQFPICDRFERSPNLDVVIDYADRRGLLATAVECKLGEPYDGRAKGGLGPVYLAHPEFWTDLPNLHELARQVSPANRFLHLAAPQLIKHILGLKTSYGPQGFRLLYLWYNVPGPEAVKHTAEIAEFAALAARDGIAFQSLTYQDVILSLARTERGSHEAYVDYLAGRYL